MRVVILMVLLLTSCAKDLITGKSTLNYYKIEDEPKLGQQVLEAQTAELKHQKKAIDSKKNAKDVKRIRTIVKRLAKVSHHPEFPFEAHLADLPIVNAWCAPGGKIMVYEGLWDPKEGLIEKGNDAQLAAVLGHEIAHATARHVTESLSKNMTIAIAGAVASSAIASGSAEGADLFGQMFDQGMNLFIPSYSRKNELEADRIGLLYMAEAGYDPREAVKIWKKAAKGKKGERTSIFASHPASGERAKQLEKYLPEAIKVYEKRQAKVSDYLKRLPHQGWPASVSDTFARHP
ncbi:MAG: M48 family metallopeptidase [Deltaproteobacteria bacterium]|nr:M48 family metallopeptidase [Deltaproteobacteria bacterium]